jgi:Domain of unknown function (DUF6969)
MLQTHKTKLVDRLKRLPQAEREVMHDAAVEATACMRALANSGTNPVTEILQGARVVEEWEHFPRGDVFDLSTSSQYYYHAHAAHERALNEHGHFHTFVRPKQLYPEIDPAAIAGNTNTNDQAAWITHLIGLSTDASGRPIRLFTTNRWVTDEVWYDSDDIIRMIDRFDITIDVPSREINRWLTCMVRMFRLQIADLIRERDARLADYRAAHPQRDVFEDRELQVISEIPVDLLAQLSAIEAAAGPGGR